MKKILLLIVFLIFLPNLSKAEKVKLLICESIYNKNLDREIWKTENNLLSQYLKDYNVWIPIPKERITTNENYIFWHAGFNKWRIDRTTRVMTKEIKMADVVKKYTYQCKEENVDKLKLN